MDTNSPLRAGGTGSNPCQPREQINATPNVPANPAVATNPDSDPASHVPEPLPESVKAKHRRKMAADPSVTLFGRDREVTQSVDVIGATKETEVQSVSVPQPEPPVAAGSSALEARNCTNNLTKTHSMLTDTIPNHPLSEMFPILDEEAQQQLVEDIKANGLIHPIIVFDGKILDGRNRYHACLDANIEPKFVTYDRDDPVSYVISQNLCRRHLGQVSGQ